MFRRRQNASNSLTIGRDSFGNIIQNIVHGKLYGNFIAINLSNSGTLASGGAKLDELEALAEHLGLKSDAIRRLLQTLRGGVVDADERLIELEDRVAALKSARASIDAAEPFLTQTPVGGDTGPAADVIMAALEAAEFDRAEALLLQTANMPGTSSERDVEVDRGASRVRLACGDVCMAAGRFDQASDHYKAALSRCPNVDVEARHLLSLKQFGALILLGEKSGDAVALGRAIDLCDAIVEDAESPDTIVHLKLQLAQARLRHSRRCGDVRAAQDAIADLEELATRNQDLLSNRLVKANLAYARQTLGDLRDGTKGLEEAVRLYADVLADLFTIEGETALDPSIVLHQYAAALIRLADGVSTERSTSHFDAALEALDRAMAYPTRYEGSLLWAESMNLRGLCLSAKGERFRDAAALLEAEQDLLAAAEVRSERTVPVKWASTQLNIANTIARSAKLTGSNRHWSRAVHVYRLVTEKQDLLENYLDAAIARTDWANALFSRAVAKPHETADLDEAEGLLQTALSFLPSERLAPARARALNTKGCVHAVRSGRTNDLSEMRLALGCFRQAAELFETSGQIANAAMARRHAENAEVELS